MRWEFRSAGAVCSILTAYSGQSDSIFSRRMKYVAEIDKSYQEKKKNVHLIKSIFPPLRRSTLVQNMTIQKRLIQYISFL